MKCRALGFEKLGSRNIFFALLIYALLLSSTARATELSLATFLSQVRENHKGYQGAVSSSKGAIERSVEAEAIYSTSLFATANWYNDSRLTNAPSVQGTQTKNSAYSLGLSKVTSFGTLAKISYNVGYTNIVGSSFLPLATFYDAKPVLEITQSLWRNGFGKETRSQVEAQNAQILSTGYAESYRAREILSGAEQTYWRLSLARATVEVQKQTLERAKKILDWAKRRVGDDLADKADLLQAEAAFEVRTLELQGALDEEQASARAFNSLLGVESDEVVLELEPLEAKRIQTVDLPKREVMRDDVRAAQQMERMAVANSELVRQRLSPSLDVMGSFSFNGRAQDLSSSVNTSLGTQYPLTQLGVKFNMPLDFGLVSDAREAALVERHGAQFNFQRRLFDQEREWIDLSRKFYQAKRRLELSSGIESLQRDKLNHEKNRLEKGRATTYTVLQMETEYSGARLNKLRAANEVLTIVAKLKTFGGEL